MLVVPSVVEPCSMSQRNRVEEALLVYEGFQGGVVSQALREQPRLDSTVRALNPHEKER